MENILKIFLRNCSELGLLDHSSFESMMQNTCLNNHNPLAQIKSDKSKSDKIKIIAAVSGGSDSIALLVLLNMYFDVIVISINHNARPESELELESVKKLCELLKVKFIRFDLDYDQLKIKNFQNNARSKRYELLTNYANEHQIKFIATGHHLDDLTETFILKIARGSGTIKANSILELKEVKIIRPLFNMPKSLLQDFLVSRNLNWIEDASNNSTKYERNKVRMGLENLFQLIDKPIFQSNLLKTVGNLEKLEKLAMLHVDQYKIKYNKYGFVIINDYSKIDNISRFYVLQKVFKALSPQMEIRAYKIERLVESLKDNDTTKAYKDACTIKNDNNTTAKVYKDACTINSRQEDKNITKLTIANLNLLLVEDILIIHKTLGKHRSNSENFLLGKIYFGIYRLCRLSKKFLNQFSISNKSNQFIDIELSNRISSNSANIELSSIKISQDNSSLVKNIPDAVHNYKPAHNDPDTVHNNADPTFDYIIGLNSNFKLDLCLKIDFLTKDDYIKLNEDTHFKNLFRRFKNDTKQEIASIMPNFNKSILSKMIDDLFFSWPIIKAPYNQISSQIVIYHVVAIPHIGYVNPSYNVLEGIGFEIDYNDNLGV